MIENLEEQHDNNSDPEVHIGQSIEINLPSVLMNAKMIREIDAAVPNAFREDATWVADISQTRIVRSKNVDAFLTALENEPETGRISLHANKYLDGFSKIHLYCKPNYASLDCDFVQKDKTEVSVFANFVRGIFSQNRRLVPKKSKSVFDRGESSAPSFWFGLNRQRITEDIISRLVTLIIGGAIGFALAQI